MDELDFKQLDFGVVLKFNLTLGFENGSKKSGLLALTKINRVLGDDVCSAPKCSALKLCSAPSLCSAQIISSF